MGLWTPRQEFESPPGYHDKPRNFPLLALPEEFSSVDLTDIVETSLNQPRSARAVFVGVLQKMSLEGEG